MRGLLGRLEIGEGVPCYGADDAVDCETVVELKGADGLGCDWPEYAIDR